MGVPLNSMQIFALLSIKSCNVPVVLSQEKYICVEELLFADG